MSMFPSRDDEYAVEEISYEDMISVLAIQENSVADSRPIPASREKLKQETNKSLSQRLADNVNIILPDWLLSH